jgi:chromosome segregation protein
LRAQEALQKQQSTLASLPLDEIQTQLAHWDTRLAVTERALADARSRLDEHRTRGERIGQTERSLRQRLVESEANQRKLEEEKAACRQAEGEVGERIEALQRLIEPTEVELEANEAALAVLQANEGEARKGLNLIEHQFTQAKITLARRQESLEALRRRIEDDFGLVAFEYAESVSGPAPLPLEGMVEQLPPVEELASDIEETLNRQRAQLRRMGAINPEAQAEYREVRERFQFLTEQVHDLTKAEADIRQVIAELDILMQREFKRTFSLVAVEFHQIFARLLGGGSARLMLTEPEDVTLTGIDIEARLPGRREQGLSLLSGGERSLTAAALVFALLRVSPTPFCVLDEVDAMLDEANVGRFRDLLRELSRATQFIVITHNRNTVQAADTIYGVTMGRDSASQVVSLKLDDVKG